MRGDEGWMMMDGVTYWFVRVNWRSGLQGGQQLGP